MRLPGGGTLPFKVFLKRLYLAQDNHAALDTAAQLGYYFILSLFPLLFVLAAVLAYLPLGDAYAQLIGRMRALVPPEAMALVDARASALLHVQHPKLLGLGLVFALWAASCSVDSARKALNLAYDVKESRPYWLTQLIAIAATFVFSMFLLLAISVLISGGAAGHWVADRLGVDRAFTLSLGVIRWPLTAALMTFGTAVGFHLLPDVKQKFVFMLPGALSSTLAWLGASWGFSQYVKHFGRYDVMYGSIGGVIVLLTWLYISGLIFVLGGEVNAILEHAALEGKEDGARSEQEPPPPPAERPSVSPPGAVKNAGVAKRAPDPP